MISGIPTIPGPCLIADIPLKNLLTVSDVFGYQIEIPYHPLKDNIMLDSHTENSQMHKRPERSRIADPRERERERERERGRERLCYRPR